MEAFSDRTAIVTGGSKGIGRAAALRLARGGASVAICGIKRDPIDETLSLAREEDLRIEGRVADVSDAEAVSSLVDFTRKQYGEVDILVNSAGIQRYGTVVETDESVWDEVLSVNLKGIYLSSKYVIPSMRERGGGAIVNVSSVQAFASQKGVAAYTASKGGINALTRAMALDHAEENIRVNAVCPASIDTPMLRWAADLFKGDQGQEEIIEQWGRFHPMNRVGKPEEVAELIAFLVHPKAGFISGGTYPIDGGMLASLGIDLPE